MKIKPESYITLKSVISGLFYTRYLHCHSLYYDCKSQGVKLGVGASHTPADILAAALTLLGRLQQRKVAVKTRKTGKLSLLL